MIEIIILHTLKNIKIIFLVALVIKLCVLVKDLTSQLFFTEKKNAVYRIIEAVLGEHCYYNKIIKKHFSKNLVMSAEDRHKFQSSNECWICNKLLDAGNNKVRDQCHIARKYGSSTYLTCKY